MVILVAEIVAFSIEKSVAFLKIIELLLFVEVIIASKIFTVPLFIRL